MLLIKNEKEALQLVNNDEAIINEVTQENQTLQKKITSDITEVKKYTVKKYMAKTSSIQKIKATQRQR